MRYLSFLCLFFILSSCYKGKKVDLIIHNGRIHVMNDELKISEAIAIKEGKIIEVGPERQILNKYRAEKVIDAQLKDVFPGFHDAHGHIMSLARQMLSADLEGARSYYEVIAMLEKYQSRTKKKILVGRGWDQSLWGETDLPTDSLLNVSFPNTPVAITRVDGHAMLINQAMMDFVGISDTTFVEDGQIIKKNGRSTGILLDHAIDLVRKKLPQPKKEELKDAILKIQDELLAAGVIFVDEAGITAQERDLLIELANEDKLKIYIYAMLFPTPDNIKFAQKNGLYKNNHLSIRSFKVIEDGALGSYGACLLKPYSDQPNTYGMLLKTPQELQEIAKIAKTIGYQLNVHCIGDSANRVVLKMIDTLMKDVPDHRWRIEHAQIIHPNDFKLFTSSGAIPSVQPSHATADQRWAQQRLGKTRLKNEGYAYKTLQENSGIILFGTDFPVVSYNPFATIHAAVERKSVDDEPAGGFLIDEAVPLDVALKAMTLWPAYGCFEEANQGTIAKGKLANIVIFDQPVKNTSNYLPNYSWMTLIDGKVAFDMR